MVCCCCKKEKDVVSLGHVDADSEKSYADIILKTRDSELDTSEDSEGLETDTIRNPEREAKDESTNLKIIRVSVEDANVEEKNIQMEKFYENLNN